MSLVLVFFPLCTALAALLVPSGRFRPLLLPFASSVHTAGTVLVLLRPSLAEGPLFLHLDPAAKVFLLSMSVLYLLVSFYAAGYLGTRRDRSNRFFVACLLASQGFITLVFWSRDLGLMWVGMESTTLVMAPLVYFNRSKQSIEATWKYLLVGSVGIALALLGIFFLAYSSLVAGTGATMNLDVLRLNAPSLSKPWLRAAFILFLAGYGTKMGLAPMHTWKPDAYGEAPGVIGAVFSGCVTSAAFLSLSRIYGICNAAGEGPFISGILIFMGLLSMAVAGAFMLNQRDFKRMLAYSSVEHMGILTLGLGLGAPALFGTMLHLMTNAMTKGVLFLSAENIFNSYGSRNIDQVRGALRRVPFSAAFFLAGFLAITGSPPFGPFASEFSILAGAFAGGHSVVGTLFLGFLLLVFIGMGYTVLRVVQGTVPADLAENGYRETFLLTAPIAACMIIVLVLGLFLPAPLRTLLREAAAYLGGAS